MRATILFMRYNNSLSIEARVVFLLVSIANLDKMLGIHEPNDK